MIRLDLADIQGNIHRPYGRFGFPHTRHFFLNIANAPAGRRFVQGVRPRITTAEPWTKAEAADGSTIVAKPPITLNIGFTFYGLYALGLPTRTLRLLPDEFIDGMGCRSEILGDVGGSAPKNWDRIWDYRPGDRAGLSLGEMTADQRTAVRRASQPLRRSQPSTPLYQRSPTSWAPRQRAASPSQRRAPGP